MLFGFLLTIIVLALAGYGFWRLDCHIFLWFLDKLCSTPSYSAHLRGRVVWITGASSGIGEYIAYEFARIGSKLVLSGTNEARLEQVRARCLELAGTGLQVSDVMVIPFNIANYSIHKSCLDRVLAHFKQLDVLINNAGRTQRANFESIDIGVDEEMFKVNVFGPVNLTRLAVEHWKRTNYQGHAVVTSSVAGIMPTPFSCTYAATKHAVHGYYETLRTEHFQNVKVTILCPGPVHSRILESAFTETPGVQVNQAHELEYNRMSTERCAKLCLVAIMHRVSTAWISIQPVLTCCYLAQYAPWAIVLIFTKLMTHEKIMKIREGK